MKRADQHEPRQGLADLRLGPFIEAVSNGSQSNPTHFDPLIELLETAPRGGHRVCFAAPRQHGKTTLIKHAFPWWAMRWPKLRYFYCTYAQTYTEMQSRDIRRITLEAGVSLKDDHNTLKGWTYTAGGVLMASSIDGPGNGAGANVAIIDDPYSGPDEALSLARRIIVYRYIKQVVFPMLAPGASVFIVASRWDPMDLSGQLIRDDGFDEHRLPAVNDGTDPRRPIGMTVNAAGKEVIATDAPAESALCPWGPNRDEPRTIEFLRELCDGRFDRNGVRKGGMGLAAFLANMQGKPPPPPGQMFTAPARCHGIPSPIVRRAIGIDLAYSEGRKADMTSGICLAELQDGRLLVEDRFWVKMDPREYKPIMRNWRVKYPGVQWWQYASGPEREIIKNMASECDPETGLFFPYELRIIINPLPARYDKKTRALRTAETCNDGALLVPWDVPWADEYIAHVVQFSGHEDDEDDDIDATVAAHDVLRGTLAAGTTPGMRREIRSRV